MKYLVLTLLLLTACGKAGSSGGSSANPAPPSTSPSGDNTYVMRLTGDNVQFTMLMVADQGLPQEEQVFTGAPVTIPAGQMVEFTATGLTLKNIQVSRTGVQVPPILTIQMYRNGSPAGSATLTTSGTFTTLSNIN